MHTHTHTHTHAQHIHTHARARAHARAHAPHHTAHTHTHTHTRTYAPQHTHTHTRAHACTTTHTHTHIQHTHTTHTIQHNTHTDRFDQPRQKHTVTRGRGDNWKSPAVPLPSCDDVNTSSPGSTWRAAVSRPGGAVGRGRGREGPWGGRGGGRDRGRHASGEVTGQHLALLCVAVDRRAAWAGRGFVSARHGHRFTGAIVGQWDTGPSRTPLHWGHR